MPQEQPVGSGQLPAPHGHTLGSCSVLLPWFRSQSERQLPPAVTLLKILPRVAPPFLVSPLWYFPGSPTTKVLGLPHSLRWPLVAKAPEPNPPSWMPQGTTWPVRFLFFQPPSPTLDSRPHPPSSPSSSPPPCFFPSSPSARGQLAARPLQSPQSEAWPPPSPPAPISTPSPAPACFAS